jgi:hypothetical protein
MERYPAELMEEFPDTRESDRPRGIDARCFRDPEEEPEPEWNR